MNVICFQTLTVRQQQNFTLQELIGNYLKAEMITNLTCKQCKSKGHLSHRKITTFSRVNILVLVYFVINYYVISVFSCRKSFVCISFGRHGRMKVGRWKIQVMFHFLICWTWIRSYRYHAFYQQIYPQLNRSRNHRMLSIDSIPSLYI